MVESQDSLYSMGSNDPIFEINSSELLRFDSQDCNSPEKILYFDSQTLLNNLSDYPSECRPFFSDEPPTPPLHNVEHLRQLPIFEDTSENEWKFDMCMSSDSGNKSAWLFSQQLNKIFVKINTPLNVYPFFVRTDPNVELYIRAMIVYSSQNDLPEPVKKCPNHKEQYPATDYPEHILRCDNADSIYCGNENGKVFDEKLAVLVPLKNIASNEPLKLIFTCQNSCSGGMNRKSTSLIFTLEDQYHNILGRKIMHFKVCSCPRRDKDKDEQTSKALPKKRKNDGSNAPSTSKKVHLLQKQDSTDSINMIDQNVVEMPLNNLPVPLITNIKQEQDTQCELKLILPNEQIKKEALRAVYNIVAGEMSRSGNLAYNNFLTEIQKQIDHNQM